MTSLIVLTAFLTLPLDKSFAGHVHGGASTNPTTYEAVTGESIDEDKTVWDSFYKSRDHVYGKEPVGFLKDHIREIPKGKAFVPAMGEGRNAIYLAKKGFIVDGNDLSDVAVERALKDAKQQHVNIKAVAGDLNEYPFPEDHYDFIMVSQFYLDNLIPKFKAALKKGGYIMFYLKVDTGAPEKKTAIEDFAVKPDTLRKALRDLDIKTFKEFKDKNEEVIGVIARKP